MKSIKQIKIKTNGKFISNYIEMALNLVKYYPDGLKLVDPKDYKQYFDWGRIGERIIERAVELKNKLN